MQRSFCCTTKLERAKRHQFHRQSDYLGVQDIDHDQNACVAEGQPLPARHAAEIRSSDDHLLFRQMVSWYSLNSWGEVSLPGVWRGFQVGASNQKAFEENDFDALAVCYWRST